MDRTKELSETAKEVLTPRYLSNLISIQSYYQTYQGSIFQELIKSLRKLMLTVKEQQNCGVKGTIQYAVISYLYSSIITKSYDFQISFYDDLLYLDPIESCIYWCPNFIFRYIDEDICFLKKALQATFIRIRDYEIDDIRRRYVEEYLTLAASLFQNNIVEILKACNIDELKLDDEVQILFGGYIDNLLKIGVIKREAL